MSYTVTTLKRPDDYKRKSVSQNVRVFADKESAWRCAAYFFLCYIEHSLSDFDIEDLQLLLEGKWEEFVQVMNEHQYFTGEYVDRWADVTVEEQPEEAFDGTEAKDFGRILKEVAEYVQEEQEEQED